MYVQLAFALDRVNALAPMHPEWKKKQPFKAVLDGGTKTLTQAGEHGMVELMMVTHADMTTANLETIVEDWFATAHHPRLKRPYTDCVYHSMLEVLAYMHASGFRTFIVSGGGVEFMRQTVDRADFRYSTGRGGRDKHQDTISDNRRPSTAFSSD
jgi:phosphoserine phosphatase